MVVGSVPAVSGVLSFALASSSRDGGGGGFGPEADAPPSMLASRSSGGRRPPPLVFLVTFSSPVAMTSCMTQGLVKLLQAPAPGGGLAQRRTYRG